MSLKDPLKAWEPRMRFFGSLPSGARILDLGCGIGYNASLLHTINPDCTVHGVDILAEESVAANMHYSQVDLEHGILPFQDNQFDAVLCTHLLEHLRNPLSLCDDISRVLKPGGRIYVEAPNWTTLFVPSFGFRREQHGPFNFFDDPTHLKPWSRHGLYVFITQGCMLQTVKIATTRLWWRIPVDLAIIVASLIKGNRSHLLAAFANLYGWSIYGIGIKPDSCADSRTAQ